MALEETTALSEIKDLSERLEKKTMARDAVLFYYCYFLFVFNQILGYKDKSTVNRKSKEVANFPNRIFVC